MAKKSTKSHIHKYEGVKWGRKKTPVLRCILPGCPHYIHIEFAKGRQSICHKCGRPFTLTLETAQRKKPKCPACVDPTVGMIENQLDGLLDAVRSIEDD